MIRAVILVLVIAAVLFGVWKVGRRRSDQMVQVAPHQRAAMQSRAVRKALVVFGCVFFIAGVWMAFAPPSDAPSGPKSLIVLIPYMVLGKYGPAAMFLGLGAACVIVARRQTRNDS